MKCKYCQEKAKPIDVKEEQWPKTQQVRYKAENGTWKTREIEWCPHDDLDTSCPDFATCRKCHKKFEKRHEPERDTYTKAEVDLELRQLRREIEQMKTAHVRLVEWMRKL